MIRGKIYADRYIVTDDGQVFAMNYRNRQLIGRLRPYRCPKERCGGYLHVSINGRRKDVHRLVAECFVPKPAGEGLEVNHKDGDKLNNHQASREFIAYIRSMNKQMNIPEHLECIKEEDIPRLAKTASKEANPSYPCPAVYSAKDLEKLYRIVAGLN